MGNTPKTSIDSLAEASRSRANFSGHHHALGAAGYREESNHPDNCEFLGQPGQSIAVSPGPQGFGSILIGAAWDAIKETKPGLLGQVLKKETKVSVDIDIGCLYEMKDGTRGAIQAFGKKFGGYETAPYILLSGDEQTGDAEGHDEYLLINGKMWDQIKRILVYIYIYEGAPRWSIVRPQIVVDVPGENDFYVTLGAHDDALALCAVAEMENVRGGIKLINRTEYFPGHEEMDRAFGFGLEWAEGTKQEE